MSALSNLINDIEVIKSDIRTSINNKGVTVSSDTPFNEYADKIDDISTAPTNPQAKMGYTNGVITYDNNPVTYYGYSTENLNSYQKHCKGETIWIASDAVAGDPAFDSTDSTGLVPDLTQPISTIYNIYDDYNSVYFELYKSTGQSCPRINNREYSTPAYDSLQSVTIDIPTLRALGLGIPSNLVVNTDHVLAYAFYGSHVSTVVCNSSHIEQYSFASLVGLNTATFTNYKGSPVKTNSETGYIEFVSDNYYTYVPVINDSWGLTVLNLPEMEIMPGSFANSSCAFSPETTTLNAPKLKGILNGRVIGNADASVENIQQHPYFIFKNSNINISNFEYMGEGIGQILEEYVSDSDNNITDTLSFPNLIYIGERFTNSSGPTFTNNLNNITQLNVPSLKCIENAASLSLNVSVYNLPSIEHIGNLMVSQSYASVVTTINIGDQIKYIQPNAFNSLDGVTINIDLPEPQSSTGDWRDNAPWGATNATVNWIGSSSEESGI